MDRAEERILHFIGDTQRLGQKAPLTSEPLSASELGRFLITLLFLQSAVEKLLEEQWLKAQGTEDHGAAAFHAYLDSALKAELDALAFLSPIFLGATKGDWKVFRAAIRRLLQDTLREAQCLEDASFQAMAASSVEKMSELMLLSARESEISARESEISALGSARVLSEVFYRAFDAMDEVFGLNFTRDQGMRNVAETKERLYEGAGLGVQTSYSTILTALYHLRLSCGAHLIDLGSGYGRLGLIAGLWRNDLRFTGYEYVAHRVEVAEEASRRAGLSDRVKFLTQDLGAQDFEIPVADAYYMYDPFCAETYLRVLRRIQEIGRSRPVAIVTKGNAGAWFTRLISGPEWHQPEHHDDGTLLIFRNRQV